MEVSSAKLKEHPHSAAKNHIVIIDDYKDAFLLSSLNAEGYHTTYINSGSEGMEYIKNEKTDLILLDLSIPEVNGFEILKEITHLDYYVPVIIISAKSSVEVKIATLNMGAVDYITKPYHYEEIIARVKVHLRKKHSEKNSSMALVQTENFEYDMLKDTLTVNHSPVQLTEKETQLLKYLISKNGEIATRDEIALRIWGSNNHVSNKAIDVQLSRLRKKINDNPENPRYILSVYGLGYRFKQ